MSSAAIYTTVGSIGRAWAVQMLDGDGSAVDLTGATGATFSMTPRAGGTRKVNAAAAVIANGTYTLADGSVRTFAPTDGVLIYQPVAGDVDTAGAFVGQFTYQLSGATVIDPSAGYLDIIIQPAV